MLCQRNVQVNIHCQGWKQFLCYKEWRKYFIGCKHVQLEWENMINIQFAKAKTIVAQLLRLSWRGQNACAQPLAFHDIIY